MMLLIAETCDKHISADDPKPGASELIWIEPRDLLAEPGSTIL